MEKFDAKTAEKLEQQYDSALHTRTLAPALSTFLFGFAVCADRRHKACN